MCGRYASARSVDDIASAFGIRDEDSGDALEPDWNVAPTKLVPAVVAREGRRVLDRLRWGLVPGWAKDPGDAARMINARLETAATKPAFRDALRARRCLLPADGWYEWAVVPGGGRQPYFLAPPDGELLAFAGLWEVWWDAEGRPLRSVAIVTGPAPDDLRSVHDRAPVVVPSQSWDDWLDPAYDDVDGLLRPTPTGAVVPHPVSAAVGDVHANGPDLIRPVAVTEQPPLF
jgi:putative SOS response-associated peptidase YedK